MSLTDDQLALLPKNILDMVARLGIADTLIVVEKLGGTTCRIAEGKTSQGREQRRALAALVGEKVETALHRHYAGEDLHVAQCKALLISLRDAAIHQAFDALIREDNSARKVVAQLARQHRLSDRWVWNILNKAPVVHASQASLFDDVR